MQEVKRAHDPGRTIPNKQTKSLCKAGGGKHRNRIQNGEFSLFL
jgi:hypothetical protein